MDYSPEKQQEIWDACLIKHWRKFGKLFDVVDEFKAWTGKDIRDCDLLRAPSDGYPWRIGVRVFVDQELPKIGDRLNSQTPDKDIALFEKLKTSKYTTVKTAVVRDRSIESVARKIRKDNGKNVYGLNNAMNRNHDTDWNVTKASKRHTR